MNALRHMLAVSCLLFAGTAAANDTALTLSQSDLFNDDVGSMIEVAVVNDGTVAYNSAVVTCHFTARGKSQGTASTTLFNLLPGSRGQDQVHLMGARADKAACEISYTTPATP